MHHFSTEWRRLRCLSELARVVKVGGLINVQAWALEQDVVEFNNLRGNHRGQVYHQRKALEVGGLIDVQAWALEQDVVESNNSRGNGRGQVNHQREALADSQ